MKRAKRDRRPTAAQAKRAEKLIRKGPKDGWRGITSLLDDVEREAQFLTSSGNEALDGVTGHGRVDEDRLDMTESLLGDLLCTVESIESSAKLAVKRINAALALVEKQGLIIRRRFAEDAS